MTTNRLQFVFSEYWDKLTMEVSDKPTSEQKSKVDAICKTLTEKYFTESVCTFHPDKVQKLMVGLRNGLLSILIAPNETCGCYDAKIALNKIADYEEKLYNQGIPKPF